MAEYIEDQLDQIQAQNEKILAAIVDLNNPPTPGPTPAPPTPLPTFAYPADVFGNGWKLTLPISEKGKVAEIRQPALATYTSKYCELTAAKDGAVFRAWHGGDTTANSKNPRSELRETYGGDTEGYWDASKGRHRLYVDAAFTRTTKVKSHVVNGQFHNEADDVFVCRLEGAKLWITDFNKTNAFLIDGSYKLGTRYTFEAVIDAGVVSFAYNGVKLTYTKPIKGKGYFRAGNYLQSNPTTAPGESTDEYSEVILYDVKVSHS